MQNDEAYKYIKFDNVSKTFKNDTVLMNVNFELEKGKIYGFVGRNGSGKTVIFKLLAGFLIPTEGEVYYKGKSLTKENKFIESLGVLIETPGFIPHYSGMKNLSILNGLSRDKVSKQDIESSIALVGLDPKEKKPVKAYSLGMRQKLGIAQAIMNNPEILILDEPMNGLDEASVKNMRKFIMKLKLEKQTTIILASHNKEDIEILCDKLFYVQGGTVLGEEKCGF